MRHNESENLGSKTWIQFDRIMLHRNDKCVDFVCELINEDTGIVLQSAMKAALAKGGIAQNRKTSCPLTQAAILDAIPSTVCDCG